MASTDASIWTGLMASPDETILQVQRLRPNAILPVRGSATAAGYDLYALEQTIIEKGTFNKVATGIAVAIPYGFYGRVAARSGLAVQQGYLIGAGVIDSDYRGEVHVVVHAPHHTIVIDKGTRFAQLIIETCANFPIVEVEQLSDTQRGTSGFGSTGLK
jgi:dUTP pyrophosphatase